MRTMKRLRLRKVGEAALRLMQAVEGAPADSPAAGIAGDVAALLQVVHAVACAVFSDLVRLHKSCCKLEYVLVKTVRNLVENGFCVPEPEGEGGDAEGELEDDVEGTGMGAGEGAGVCVCGWWWLVVVGDSLMPVPPNQASKM